MANDDAQARQGEDERAAGSQVWFWAAMVVLLAAGNQYSRELWQKGPHLAYADVLLAAIFCAWAAWVLATGRWRQVKWPPRPAWAFAIVGFLSLLIATSLKAGLAELLQTVLYMGCAYMLFANTVSTETRVRTAVKLLMAMTAVLGLLAVVQYVRDGFEDPIRVSATFETRSVYSLYMLMALPVIAAVVAERLRAPDRPYWMMWLLTAALAVLLLTCTAGALLLIAGGAVLYVAFRRASAMVGRGVFIGDEVVIWQGALIALCSVAVITAVAPVPTQEGVVDLFTLEEVGQRVDMATGEEDGSGEPETAVRKRWIEWLAALNLMADRTADTEVGATWENFLLGVGIGNYQKHINTYYHSLPNLRKIEPDTSNLYLVTAASMGFAGLVCLIWYFLHFWRLARGLYDTAEGFYLRALGLGLAGSVAGVMVANLFTNSLVRGTGIILMFLLALVTIVAGRRGESDAAEGVGPPPLCVEDNDTSSGCNQPDGGTS